MPYEVIKRTEREEVVGVQMGSEKRKFRSNGTFRLDDKDSALAKDIQQKFGQDGSMDVLVAEVPSHRTGRTFAVGRVPWHENKE